MSSPDVTNTNEQVMPIWEMHNSPDFCFGKAYRKNVREPYRKIHWNINSDSVPNGNMIILGMSGSYKSRLIREIVRNMTQNDLNLHVIDLQGDMYVEGEKKCIKIKLRKDDGDELDSNIYGGINIFEFDKISGGPKGNAKVIVSIIKKAVMPNMGTLQFRMLTKLIKDFYAFHEIHDHDRNTWDNPLPGMRDFQIFFRTIYKFVTSGEFENSDILKIAKKIDRLSYKLFTMNKEDIYTQDELDDIAKKINDEKDKLIAAAEQYPDVAYNKISKPNEVFKMVHEKFIDIESYTDKKTISTMEGIAPLIEELADEPIFQGDSFEVDTDGTIRYDLSDLTNEGKPISAIFYIEIFLNKIFRYAKSRGEYAKLKSKKRGKKYDTVVVMDESKLILPTGADKENSYVLQHRIASEGRKYGLCGIWATQLARSYTREILANSATKVILKTDSVQRKEVAKQFAIANIDDLELTKTSGIALIELGGHGFVPVVLPFANKKDFDESGNIKKMQRPF